MKLTKTCISCGKVFQIPKGSSHRGKYCNNLCRRKQKVIVRCFICHKTFEVSHYRKEKAKYCSYICYGKSLMGKSPWNKDIKTGIIPKTAFKKGHPYGHRFPKGHIPFNKGKKHLSGDKHGMWNGGITKGQGYVFIWKLNHPFCNEKGYVKRCKLIAEEKIGRFIKRKEIIHHINGIKDDDRPENLYLFKNHSKHMKFHSLIRKNPDITLKSNLCTH